MSEQVVVFDTTLRDGEQTPGTNFSSEDKLQIAERLAGLGVDIIEAGSPFSGPEDQEVVKTIAETVSGPVICGLARLDEKTSHSDVEVAWEALEPASSRGGARIHTYIGTSPWQMRKLGFTDESQVVDAVKSGVAAAKGYTKDVEFSPEDASRTDFDFMMRVILEAVDAGATTVNIPDTVGKAQPGEYATRLRNAKRMIDERFGAGTVIISAHCHDDLGNATANTVAAVTRGGARQVEVALGGLGERAGNASLEQVVANLKESYPRRFKTNIDTTLLTSVVRETMQKADVIIQPTSPIVGPNSFAHEAGTHQAGVRKDRRTYEYLQAEDYGQEGGEMVIAKLSGKAGFSERIADLGIRLHAEQIKAASTAAKEFGATEKRELTDVDIERIVYEEILGRKLKDRFLIDVIDVRAVAKRDPSTGYYNEHDEASVTISDVRLNRTVTQELRPNETHSGLIHASVLAVNQAIGVKGRMKDWDANARGSGSYATGGIFLKVSQIEIDTAMQMLKMEPVTSYAEGENVVTASLIGYVKGLNLLQRMVERGIRPKPLT